MSSVTQILSAIEQGDPSRAEELLPLVYEELRRLAAAKLANEKPGQTLQAAALVHEAYRPQWWPTLDRLQTSPGGCCNEETVRHGAISVVACGSSRL
jgi:hypothetical protein